MTCRVCGRAATRRTNYRRGKTCGATPCVRARNAAGGRAGRGRPKIGMALHFERRRAREAA